jgi:xanthine permease XanP
MNNPTKRENTPDIILGLNDKPPAIEALLTALQHLMAIFIGIITPPLIILAGHSSFHPT